MSRASESAIFGSGKLGRYFLFFRIIKTFVFFFFFFGILT